MKELDKRALQQWDKAEITYINYANFISKKKDKFKLTLIDLLYVSNFKGGYATINEPEEIVGEKLISYGLIFEEINARFYNKHLSKLEDNEVIELINFSNTLILLTEYKCETKINGFSVSFLTTLMHFHFPNLFPILDRRVLNGLSLIDLENDLNSQNQVKKIQTFYPELIWKFKIQTINKSIRELDKELFIIKFQTT